jgi:hypothetical protein
MYRRALSPRSLQMRSNGPTCLFYYNAGVSRKPFAQVYVAVASQVKSSFVILFSTMFVVGLNSRGRFACGPGSRLWTRSRLSLCRLHGGCSRRNELILIARALFWQRLLVRSRRRATLTAASRASTSPPSPATSRRLLRLGYGVCLRLRCALPLFRCWLRLLDRGGVVSIRVVPRAAGEPCLLLAEVGDDLL